MEVGTIYQDEKGLERACQWFCFSPVEAVLSIRHPGLREQVRYMILEFRRKVWAGDQNLSLITASGQPQACLWSSTRPGGTACTFLEPESARASGRCDSKKTEIRSLGIPEPKEEKPFQEARSGQAHQMLLRANTIEAYISFRSLMTLMKVSVLIKTWWNMNYCFSFYRWKTYPWGDWALTSHNLVDLKDQLPQITFRSK